MARSVDVEVQSPIDSLVCRGIVDINGGIVIYRVLYIWIWVSIIN